MKILPNETWGVIALVSVFAIAAAILVGGCDFVPEKVEKPIKEFPLGEHITYMELSSTDGFQYIKVDGHQYLVFACNHRFGMTHSPKCECLKKENIIE